LAIFLGQVAASLVSGNTVIAKPAEQTPLIAYLCVTLFYKAGVPKDVLQLLLGDGMEIGAGLVKDPRIKGVLFTGSTDTARAINQSLASREGEISPLIAETGGQNAMIVGSSALLEQVVADVLVSSFGSAGQRCSALRVVYVQRDIYDDFKTMLKGGMAELKVGSSYHYETDVGPVIDKAAKALLDDHIEALKGEATLIYQVPLDAEAEKGVFVQPSAFEIESINVLKKEHFGPILHVIPYDKKDIQKVIAEINGTGFGLTLGIHSRIDAFTKEISDKIHVGNCYINRNMTGAVVGLQPFGGQGLSGTGPKAGGPLYLLRLCHEKTLTVDTTAAGGNASLMSHD
jgi:RHH-type proline utilization regulon transcriptional repressor/proline dehydrogenase/delta 1-pyrroline-5-carboxylate dehydrogenase